MTLTALPACVKEVLFALIKDEAIEMPELPMSPKDSATL